jgi:hypothetical protein
VAVTEEEGGEAREGVETSLWLRGGPSWLGDPNSRGPNWAAILFSMG